MYCKGLCTPFTPILPKPPVRLFYLAKISKDTSVKILHICGSFGSCYQMRALPHHTLWDNSHPLDIYLMFSIFIFSNSLLSTSLPLCSLRLSHRSRRSLSYLLSFRSSIAFGPVWIWSRFQGKCQVLII